MYFVLLLPAELINFAKVQIAEQSDMTDNFNLGEWCGVGWGGVGWGGVGQATGVSLPQVLQHEDGTLW